MKKRQRKNSSSSCKNRKQLKLSSVQRPLKPMLSHFSLLHSQQQPQSLLQNTLINDSDFDFGHQSSKLDADFSDVGCSEILSQDFFWYFSFSSLNFIAYLSCWVIGFEL